MNLGRTWATGTLLALMATFGLESPGEAANPCPSGRAQSNFGGGSTSSTNTYGVRARIEYNNPDLCGNDTTGPGLSTAWSMITAGWAVAGGNAAWAQSGYIQLGTQVGFGSNGIRQYYQYTRACWVRGTCQGSDALRTKFFGAPSESQFYSSYLSSSDDRTHMTAGGADLGTVEYDVTGDWAPAWSAQIGAETYHYQDDVPGTSSDPTSYDYFQRYTANGSLSFLASPTWKDPTGPRYHRTTTNPSSGGLGMNVWTDPL